MRHPIVSPLALFALAACASPEWGDTAEPSLEETFQQAAIEHDVPRDLLVAIAYSMTRLQEGEEGAHEHAGVTGFGLMDLGAGSPQDGPDRVRAANRLGVNVDLVEEDTGWNIQAAASELRFRADELEQETGLELDDVSDWAEVVGWYSGSEDGGAQRSFAKQVYRWIEGGLVVRASDGQWIQIEPREVDLPLLDVQMIGTGGDSSLASNFVQAHSSNYTNQSRTAGDIDMIVVHTAQGSYSGTYNWFQNSAANATAHYVLRSSDGEITQMVWEEDKAWHAGHSSTNSRSIGIEQEGYIEEPGTWYTDAMYSSLAALIVDISDRQGVPLDRDHVIGHTEVPGCAYSGGGASCHTDPGSGFDWDLLFDKIHALSGSGSGSGSGGGSGSTSPSGSGDLVGFVRADSIYDTAAGIAGATVSLSTGDSTTTDGNGWYSLSGVTAGATDITVVASGYDDGGTTTEIDAGITNWGSVALVAGSSSGGGSTTPSTSWSDGSPSGWTTVYGPGVTLDWGDGGASTYEVKIYWYDGSDWNYYYAYTTSETEKTYWPVVDDTYYAWTVRKSGDAWSDLHYFYFEN